MNNVAEQVNHLNLDELDFVTELTGLSQCVDNEQDIRSCLQSMAEMVATLLHVNRCSIMLLKKDHQSDSLKLRVCAHYGDLPDEAYLELVDLDNGISGKVAGSGEPLLVERITGSEYRNVARFGNRSQDDGFIVCPLVVSDTVIGVVNVSQPEDQRVFSTGDLKTASIVALFLSQSIQIYQLQHLLRSHFVKLALAKESRSTSVEALDELVSNNEKMVKVLARSFFGEMKSAGFSSDLIVSSATEIISLVTQEMAENKKR